MRLSLSFLVLAAAVAGCAPAPGQTAGAMAAADTAAPRACFRPSEIRNFRSDTPQTVYVRTSAADVFQVQASGGCRGLDTANAIELRPQVGTGRVCAGDMATLTVLGARDTCRVRAVKRLSEQDLAALPGRLRP